MQAASRESYLAAAERLSGYAQGAQPSATAQVADEILAVGRLLAREPRLRRALADSARAGEERSELLRTVLAGKISEDALDLLAALVAGDPELAAALGDSSTDIERRATLVHDLLDGKAKPVTARLAELALAGFGGRGFQASLTRLVELAADRRDASVAYVTAAVLPTEEQERRLAATLSEMYGREVSLKITVDPRVIGGMRVRVGSDLFDGTISRRLAEARIALAK